MNRKHLALVGRVLSELDEIKQAVQRVPLAWERAHASTDDLYYDSVALNLHGFYSGLERIFELIAGEIDGSRPQGDNWHQQLLRQMAAEIPKVRPAVISVQTRDLLDEYRGFRHVVRNVYAFCLTPSRMEHLVNGLAHVFERVENELVQFCEILGADSGFGTSH